MIKTERLSRVNYTPSKNALVPKKCKHCNQNMELKQINLTEAVRQCYKCSIPLEELDISDVEFFHRSYQDVRKNPAEWNLNVGTEEAELDKLGSWIEQFNLTLDKYEETSDDSAHMASNFPDFPQKLKNVGIAVKNHEKESNFNCERSLDKSQLSSLDQSGSHIDAMEELDAVLAKASAENFDSGSLPFSLDDLFLQREQEPSDSGSVSGMKVAGEIRDTSQSNHEFSKQIEMCDTFLPEPGAIMSQSNNSLSCALNINIRKTCNVIEDISNVEQSEAYIPDNISTNSEDTIAVVSAGGESPLNSFENADQTRSLEVHEATLSNQEGGLPSEFEKSWNDKDSLTAKPSHDVEINSLSIPIQTYNNVRHITSSSTEVSVNGNKLYSRKRTGAAAGILSTVASDGILLNVPSDLLTTETVQAEPQSHENRAYRHVCDCDDSSLQLNPLLMANDSHCLDFRLPPLFYKKEITEESVQEETVACQSDIDKVVFAPVQLVQRSKRSLGLHTPSRQSNSSSMYCSETTSNLSAPNLSVLNEASDFNDLESTVENGSATELSAMQNDQQIMPCPKVVFTIPAVGGTSQSDSCQDIVVTVPVTYGNHQSISSHSILVTIPADDDITEGMLQSVSLEDLPILIGCSDGIVKPTCSTDFLSTPPVNVASDTSETLQGIATPLEDQSSIHGQDFSSVLSPPLYAFEEFCTDPKIRERNTSSVFHNYDPQCHDNLESVEAQFSDGNSTPFTSVNSMQHLLPDFPESSSRINCGGDFDDCQKNRAASSVDEIENSLLDDRNSSCHFVVDQPLRLFNSTAEDDDDELSSFTGAKFKPLGIRKSPHKIGTELKNFLAAVRGEIRSSAPSKRDNRKSD